MSIDTEALSAKYRSRLVDTAGKRILLSKIGGSRQEGDLTKPPNAGGLGRIRHFYRQTSPHWIPNPLPIDPACARLSLGRNDSITAQVFQNGACNWRCWYCYVPFDMLAAAPSKSRWTTVRAIVEAFLEMADSPPLLDLSGGQPELTPEWVLWTIEALEELRGTRRVYLWSDDNLSNDYFWRYLTDSQRAYISGYRLYGRVGCFKGFDEESFAFNTDADPSLYTDQFSLFRRYIEEGIDMYGYATITHPGSSDLRGKMRSFIDRLQSVNPMLPLRVVPLEICSFGPVVSRLDPARERALTVGQYQALDEWRREIESRYTAEDRATNISDVILHR